MNVSAVQFRRQDVAGLVEAALREASLHPSLLRLEITETSLMSVGERATELLQRLRAMGISLALDDFGTGYSSLSYLKSFPLDMLKIDRSFIAEMLNDATAASITEAIITMARILELPTIAEGVENVAQLDFLRQLGCETVQGFHFSGAVPGDKLAL